MRKSPLGVCLPAAALTALLEGSDIRMSHLEGDERVQDPYCLRCQPQVAGAALDLLMQMRDLDTDHGRLHPYRVVAFLELLFLRFGGVA